MNILDLDLDFFLDEVSSWVLTEGDQRLDSSSYTPWEPERVREFLSSQCGLDTSNKIPGKIVTHHHEVFYESRRLIEEKHAKIFVIDHVDAHADLGLGDGCYYYLFFDLLRKPVQERYYPDEDIDPLYSLGSGNYLLYMIACEWIWKLRYIHLDRNRDDLHDHYFKNFNTKSGKLKLRTYCPHQVPENFDFILSRNFVLQTNPCKFGKDIPFKTVYHEDFVSDRKYDYIFLSHSPTHTPVESDDLIPVILEYIEQE